jgi:cytoskeletal protein CcmA (bactofilin family)
MFDRKPTSSQLSFTNEIGSGSKVLGNLEGNGNVRVLGHFVGNITEALESKATLVIDKDGVLTGDLNYTNLIVAGTIEGTITVDEKIEVYPGALIHGDIHYKSIDIHPNARVNGLLTCSVLDQSAHQPSDVIAFDLTKKIAS